MARQFVGDQDKIIAALRRRVTTDSGDDHGYYPARCWPLPTVISRDVISYLKLAGSRLSIRPLLVSACGYIRKLIGAPADLGSVTSCPKLYATQFISHDPNSRVRRFLTISSSSGRFPGGSSRITLRTSAGSTGTQP